MKSGIRHIYFNFIVQIFLFLLLLALDFFSKSLALSGLRDNPDIILVKNVISFHYLENTGAAFGIFNDSSFLFIALSSVILCVLIFLSAAIFSGLKRYINNCSGEDFNRKTVHHMIMLGYILSVLGAGAAGNLIDRIRYGYVIDFIKLDFISFPVFNAADIYVTVSVVVLIIFFVFLYKEDKNFHIFRH